MERAAAPAIYSFPDPIKASAYDDLYINFSDISDLFFSQKEKAYAYLHMPIT